MISGRRLLILGGCLSLAASFLHLACIAGGPEWFRFFGAGEGIAAAVERGEATPILLTVAIAAILALWAAYGFSGGGLIRPLPLLRTGLVAISAVYLSRGLMILMPAIWNRPDLSAAFMLWSSLIVFVFGLVHAIGTWLAWPSLTHKEAH